MLAGRSNPTFSAAVVILPFTSVKWAVRACSSSVSFVHQSEEAALKVVHCPCGTNVEGETDDALVENVQGHIAADHPDLVGKYSREQILEMAHEH